MIRRPHVVLLDVDGTLVDSNDAHARAWVEVLRRNGFPVELAHVRPLIGKGGDKIVPELTGLAPGDRRIDTIGRERMRVFIADYLPYVRPFPKVRELLLRLKSDGRRLVVASSAQADELEPLLALTGADALIESRASSADVEHSKPDPDLIAAALHAGRAEARQAILLGDTPYDVTAAAWAGVRTVGLRSGGSTNAELQARSQSTRIPPICCDATKARRSALQPTGQQHDQNDQQHDAANAVPVVHTVPSSAVSLEQASCPLRASRPDERHRRSCRIDSL